MHTTGGITKIESCEYTPVASSGDCPADTDPDPNGADCRRSVPLTPGAKVCATGFGIVSGKCVRYVTPGSASPQCPSGSVEDAAGDCRKPVADAAGAYYCKDANAALNGKSCVWTAGFLIEPSPTLYKCDSGARTVIGSGSATLSRFNRGSKRLQGVLSTDNLYCIVPRIDTAPAAAVAAHGSKLHWLTDAASNVHNVRNAGAADLRVGGFRRFHTLPRGRPQNLYVPGPSTILRALGDSRDARVQSVRLAQNCVRAWHSQFESTI
ncbi:hypothetical protein GQR58_030463 [Nymphon striatum]|nr:hypothetical protein GQR58_030463 [Nymphon striatum]